MYIPSPTDLRTAMTAAWNFAKHSPDPSTQLGVAHVLRGKDVVTVTLARK